MNQILNTKSTKNRKEKRFLYFQFIFSAIFALILFIFGIITIVDITKKETYSNTILSNYNIYKLYQNSKENNTINSDFFGIIEIPKIDVYYPVFSELTEENLSISPCKFYGESPNLNGNICIAGHNYDNSLFFSKISSLTQNDEIFLFDNNKIKFEYFVIEIYEVKQSDLSPIFNYNKNEKNLTLVTCNNFNNNRIILKAHQKKPSK